MEFEFIQIKGHVFSKRRYKPHSENTLTTFKNLTNRLLKNHLANFNQTWHKVVLGKGESTMLKLRVTASCKGGNRKTRLSQAMEMQFLKIFFFAFGAKSNYWYLIKYLQGLSFHILKYHLFTILKLTSALIWRNTVLYESDKGDTEEWDLCIRFLKTSKPIKSWNLQYFISIPPIEVNQWAKLTIINILIL